MVTARLFAEGTEVSPEKSQSEIAGLAQRYGAQGYMMGWQEDRAVVEFATRGRRVRFVLDLSLSNFDDRTTPGGRQRPPSQRPAARAAEVRRRWRTLALAIKAKFDVVESGIESFEQAFLANIVLPNNETVAQAITPRIAEAYDTGMVSPMLELGAGSD